MFSSIFFPLVLLFCLLAYGFSLHFFIALVFCECLISVFFGLVCFSLVFKIDFVVILDFLVVFQVSS